MIRKITSVMLIGAIGYAGVGFAENTDANVRKEINKLQDLIKEKPENSGLYIKLGKQCLQMRDWDGAVRSLKKARALRAAGREWMIPLGRAYLEQHQYQAILTEIQMADHWITEDILAQEVLLLRAHAYFHLNATKESTRIYEDLLQINSELGEAWYGLARTAFQNGDLDLAKKQLQLSKAHGYHDDIYMSPKIETMGYKDTGQSIEAYRTYSAKLKEKNTRAEGLLGLTYMTLLDENMEEFSMQATALYQYMPKSSEAMYLYALSAYQKGRISEATATLSRCLDIDNANQRAYYLLIKIYCEKADFLKARMRLEQLQAQAPDNPILLPLLAIVNFKLQFFDQASIYLGSLRAQAPQDYRWAALDGSFSLALQRADIALDRYHMAATLSQGQNIDAIDLSFVETKDPFYQRLKIAPSIALDTFVHKEALLTLQKIQLGAHEEAVLHATAFLKQSPNPLSNYFRGYAASQMEDFNDAIYFYEQALREQPLFLAALNKLAECYLHTGDFQNAEAQLILSRDIDEKNTETALLVARALDLQGRQEDTVAWLKEAIDKNPTYAEPAMALMMFYSKIGDTQRAYVLAKETITRFPENINVIEAFASIALQAKQYDDAFYAYEILNRKYPNTLKNLLALASCLIARNDDVKASDVLDRAFKIDPGNRSVLMLSMQIAKHRNQYDTVIELGEKVLYQDPMSVETYDLMGEVYVAQSNLSQANILYQEAFESVPSVHFLEKLFHVRMALGASTSALQGLEDWLVLHPEDMAIRHQLAAAYAQLQDYMKAILIYEHLLLDNHSDVVALRNLSELYGRYDTRRSLDFAERAYALDPQDSNNMNAFGWALVMGGSTQKGMSLLQKAADKDPENMEVRYHLAIGKKKSGDLEGARQDLTIVLQSAKSSILRDAANTTLQSMSKKSS